MRSRPDLKDVREVEATTESGREFHIVMQRIEKNLFRASVYANGWKILKRWPLFPGRVSKENSISGDIVD